MKEIKFRQPLFNNDGTFNSWHYWGWISEGNFVSPLSMAHNVKGVFGLQFTGLTDKNGNEIWEGDLLNSSFANGDCRKDKKFKNFISEVYFASGAFHFKPHGDIFYGDYRWYPQWEECEVIGNIYENPELVSQ